MDALDVLPKSNIPEQCHVTAVTRVCARASDSFVSYQIPDDNIARASNRNATFDVKTAARRTERRRPFPAWLVALSSGWWADGWFPISLGRRCFQDEQYRTRQVSKCNGSLAVPRIL